MVRLGLIEEDITLRSTLYVFFKQQPNITCSLVAVSMQEFENRWEERTFLDVVWLGPSCNHARLPESIRKINLKAPKCKVIVLMPTEDIDWMFELVCSGATAHVFEPAWVDHCPTHILSLCEGELSFSPQLALRIQRFFEAAHRVDSVQPLNEMEHMLLLAMQQETSALLLSERLHISIEKQQQILKNIHRKLVASHG